MTSDMQKATFIGVNFELFGQKLTFKINIKFMPWAFCVVSERFAVNKVIHLIQFCGTASAQVCKLAATNKSLENICSPCPIHAFDVILPILYTANGIYLFL